MKENISLRLRKLKIPEAEWMDYCKLVKQMKAHSDNG